MDVALQFGRARAGLDYLWRPTAFGLVVHDGQLACVRVDRGDASYLDLPGGAVDGDETEEQALVREFVEGPVSSEIPASVLQFHTHAVVVLDEAAASKLKRRDYYKWVFANKWRVGQK